MSEETFPCPQCGKIASRTDILCKNCGADLTELHKSAPTVHLPAQPITETHYERKFSVAQRYYKLLSAPSEAMKDIALAPDYIGYFGILALDCVVVTISLVVVMQKIQFVGTYAGQISSALNTVLAVALFIALFMVVIRWLVKSFIVKYVADSGSGWAFSTAASVTGYAYFADIIFSIVGIAISWFVLPTFRIDTADLTTALQQMNAYRSQLNTIKLTFTLPFGLLGITWKSFLGALGTYFGTNKKCSIRTGFIIFFVLSLLGLLVSFVSSM